MGSHREIQMAQPHLDCWNETLTHYYINYYNNNVAKKSQHGIFKTSQIKLF